MLEDAASEAQLEFMQKLQQRAQAISQSAAEKVLDPTVTPEQLQAAARQLARQLQASPPLSGAAVGDQQETMLSPAGEESRAEHISLKDSQHSEQQHQDRTKPP